jgi:hypothetical protein
MPCQPPTSKPLGRGCKCRYLQVPRNRMRLFCAPKCPALSRAETFCRKTALAEICSIGRRARRLRRSPSFVLLPLGQPAIKFVLHCSGNFCEA